jgi:hypothetical protein
MAMEGRLTKVADIAPIVAFLCTSGGWVTSQTIFANGDTRHDSQRDERNLDEAYVCTCEGGRED